MRNVYLCHPHHVPNVNTSMKIAYFDCFSGISGDMAVGALLDAGVPLTVVEEALRQVGIGSNEATVSVRTLSRNQIHATKFDVTVLPERHSAAESHRYEHDESPQHRHDDETGHAHQHKHEYPEHIHEPPNGHTHHHETFATIMERVAGSDLSERAKDIVQRIFRAIGLAEARIHNATLDDVHFHEVGALDSIADIVAVAACLDHLGVAEIYTSAIPLGSGGFVTTQHGTMPLPAPATLEILKGYPVQLTSVPFELTTPTGAGIVKALSHGTLAMELIQVERVGFGAGTRELKDRPNLLRVIVGELVAGEEHDTVTVIETNIDDLSPLIYPYLLERLMEAGAHDAYLTAVHMKKGRPGTLLTVVAGRGAVDELTKLIYRETTSIGVRYSEMERRKLPREEILALTEWGTVRMKRIESPDGVRVAPEYEEARRIARERALPLHGVIERLDEVARHVADDSRAHSRS